MKTKSTSKKTPWVLVVSAVLTGLSIPLTVASANSIPSSSMEPTLYPGDQVLVNRLDRDPRRGEVIVFRDSQDWLGNGREDLVIKRVIGLPRDQVECCTSNGQTLVNGQALVENYALPEAPGSQDRRQGGEW